MNLTRPDGPDPTLTLSRRSVGALAGFAGYAAAICPVHAQAITTSSNNLITGMVSYPSQGFELQAFIARPAAAGQRPVVLVVHEIFGLHDYIRDVCRRLAQEGYVAIAPALFLRAGDPAPLTDFAHIMPIVNKATNAQVMGDIEATIKWLDTQFFVNKDALGITGFCWGGSVVWMACAYTNRLKAGVAWYGRLEAREGSTDMRKWPIEIAGDLNSPVLGLYAEHDSGIPLTSVEAMQTKLKQAGNRTSQLIIYPGTQHGFHADYRPQYNQEAAQSGWAAMLSWFRANHVK
ncbi:dienelactone hydrolase family protein [Candidatus Phycosocius spiralis]|uniref:Carboxymethylenebutenolidase n=1 Tax=Candidatus Phycosocius spiralis TaxID=2815099 RepID=A0ABQ4PXJ7_9PROT|nr:dienelactone hydrolase family protein [Candidatus Phycosocius spiralis]GIU67762.1 carboxymethylenebutenolidase [Candidatus Phycosocius spiralis]